MSFEWDSNKNEKLRTVLFGLIDGRPKQLIELASDTGVYLATKNDRARFKYRIKKIVAANKELQYFGYTSKGYIVPKYYDEFEKIILHLKRIGDGMVTKAKKVALAAKTTGVARKSEQLSMFDIFDVENW